MAYPTEHLTPAERALHTDLALIGSIGYSMAAEMVMDSRSPSFVRRCIQLAESLAALHEQVQAHVDMCCLDAEKERKAFADSMAKNKARQGRKTNAA